MTHSELDQLEDPKIEERRPAKWYAWPLVAWRKVRSHWLGRLGTEVLLVALILWGVTAWQSRNLVRGGEPAPDFELHRLDGELESLQAHRGEKVVLVFWAPWCTVCGLEAGNISDLDEDPDITVLSVVLSFEDRASIEGFVDEHDVRYPVLLGTSDVGAAYKIDAFPTIYLIDEDGNIKSSLVGYTTELGVRARLGEVW